MKTLKLFVVAAIATVAFASCGGGTAEKAVDSLAVDTTVVIPAVDTTTVVDSVAADTTKK